MLYSVIDTQKGEGVGFTRVTHRLITKGEKMIVNENELRKVNENIEEAAKSLGGKLLSHSQVMNIIKKSN